jgi:hypothetical protein
MFLSQRARSCGWRILKYARICHPIQLLRYGHARPDYSLHPSHHYGSPDCPSRRSTFCGCRVRSHQTSAPDRESLAPPCPKPPRLGSVDRRFLFALDKPDSPSEGRNRIKTVNRAAFPSRSSTGKYRLLFSPKCRAKPGPKGPNPDVIWAVVDMKQRNPTWRCPRIAEQITLAFGIPINKDVVRRILALHYRPVPDRGGPSWLTFLGHMKDSLWSVDLNFDANRWPCERTGCWWSWISTHAASSDLEFKRESWMVWRSAACSIKRFAAKLFRNI